MFGSFKRLIRACVLLWAWQLPRARERHAPLVTSINREWQSRKREERQRKRLRQQSFSRPPGRLVVRGGYRGSASRDKRFSNQQMLRRMFRNC